MPSHYGSMKPKGKKKKKKGGKKYWVIHLRFKLMMRQNQKLKTVKLSQKLRKKLKSDKKV